MSPSQKLLRTPILLVIAFVFVATQGTAQAQSLGLVWSAPTQVANGALYDNIRPQITLVNDETPALIWASTTGGKKAWATRWNGSGFDMPTQINPTGQINAYTVEGPNIAAKGDTVYAVYTTSPSLSAQIMIRGSFDGGLTWNTPVWVDSLGTDMPTFANIGIMDGGQPVVMYMRQTTTYANPRYVIRRSTDAGQTWLPEVEASTMAPGGETCDCCTGQVYWQDQKLVVTYRNNNANVRDMWASISTDAGSTFTSTMDLDTTDWTLAACPSSGPVSIFVGDTIYTAFMSQGGNGQARIYLGASHLGTGQLGYNWLVNDTASGAITQNYPAIAGSGDTIIIAWYQNNGTNPEIALRYSFSGPTGLFDNPVQYVSGWANGIQSFPDMEWANGKLHLVWQSDATGQVMYVTGTVGIPLATDGAQPSWQIYPNPSDGHFEIRNLPSEGYRLIIHDAVGHAVFAFNGTTAHALELDLTTLAAGIYFVTVEPNQGQQLVTKRLLLQK